MAGCSYGFPGFVLFLIGGVAGLAGCVVCLVNYNRLENNPTVEDNVKRDLLWMGIAGIGLCLLSVIISVAFIFYAPKFQAAAAAFKKDRFSDHLF